VVFYTDVHLQINKLVMALIYVLRYVYTDRKVTRSNMLALAKWKRKLNLYWYLNVLRSVSICFL